MINFLLLFPFYLSAWYLFAIYYNVIINDIIYLCAFQMLENGVHLNSCLQLYCILMASRTRSGNHFFSLITQTFKQNFYCPILIYKTKKEFKKILAQRTATKHMKLNHRFTRFHIILNCYIITIPLSSSHALMKFEVPDMR